MVKNAKSSGPRDATPAEKLPRVRIDTLIVERGLAPSPERARALIMSGAVLVSSDPRDRSGGRPVEKPGTRVASDAGIRLRAADHPYVSRGGSKLAAALDGFSVDPRGLVALDVGASTGGFTDCLLRRGAARVIAVDVGYGQFDWRLRNDPRVVLFERQNIRHLSANSLPVAVDLVVIDVSFVSLRLILDPVRALCRPEAGVVALVKPQFEVAKGRVGKGGVVRDGALRTEAIGAVMATATRLGYTVVESLECPVPGQKGNIETFVHARAPGSLALIL